MWPSHGGSKGGTSILHVTPTEGFESFASQSSIAMFTPVLQLDTQWDINYFEVPSILRHGSRAIRVVIESVGHSKCLAYRDTVHLRCPAAALHILAAARYARAGTPL